MKGGNIRAADLMVVEPMLGRSHVALQGQQNVSSTASQHLGMLTCIGGSKGVR